MGNRMYAEDEEGSMKLRGGTVFAMALTVMFAAGPAYGSCDASSAVFGTATQTGAAIWTYDFSVQNGCASNQPFPPKRS
jgi:hypothetical protein